MKSCRLSALFASTDTFFPVDSLLDAAAGGFFDSTRGPFRYSRSITKRVLLPLLEARMDPSLGVNGSWNEEKLRLEAKFGDETPYSYYSQEVLGIILSPWPKRCDESGS